MARTTVTQLARRVDLLETQQAKIVAGLARAAANLQDNPEAAQQELRTWLAAVDPTLDFEAMRVPKGEPLPHVPAVMYVGGHVAGMLRGTPLGVILHGTRSGQDWDVQREFAGTVAYVRGGAGGLSWHATIGDLVIAIHLAPQSWGWNAREHSTEYLAVEFAQATVHDEITDGQVRAFCWWYATKARALWPDVPPHFPCHSELAAGVRDGKSDPWPRGSPLNDDLRSRILAELRERYGIEP